MKNGQEYCRFLFLIDLYTIYTLFLLYYTCGNGILKELISVAYDRKGAFFFLSIFLLLSFPFHLYENMCVFSKSFNA